MSGFYRLAEQRRAEKPLPLLLPGPTATFDYGPKFEPSKILAEVLDSYWHAKKGPLSQLLESGQARNLPEALEKLSDAQHAILRRELSQGTLEKFQKLSQEQGKELFYRGLLLLAEELIEKKNANFAQGAYLALKWQNESPEIKKQGEERYTRLRSFTAENFFKALGRQTFDLPSLAGMVVGVRVFRPLRLQIAEGLRRFNQISVPNGGFFLRAIPGVAALLGEGIAFTAAETAVRAFLYPEGESGFKSFTHYLGLNTLLLGGMRFLESPSRSLQRFFLHRERPFVKKALYELFVQGCMLSGILMAQFYNMFIMGKEISSPLSSSYGDSMAFLLKHNMARLLWAPVFRKTSLPGLEKQVFGFSR